MQGEKETNKGLLLDIQRAFELVIRDAGGEKALKEFFLKEQDEKMIDELAKLNPMIAETFKQRQGSRITSTKRIDCRFRN